MVPPTRRQLLQVATAVTAGLAGCGAFVGEESGTSRSVSEGTDTSISGGDTEIDPETVVLRSGTETPPIRLADSDGESNDADHRERPSLHGAHAIVDTRARARKLVVADGVDGKPVESFLSATDFESETLYLETRIIRECFRLQLCEISWSADEIRSGYVRKLRPYDEQCAADKEIAEAWLVRIPAPLDSDEITTYGSSVDGSGECHRRSQVESEDADASDGEGASAIAAASRPLGGGE
jgi:hypothetical protein